MLKLFTRPAIYAIAITFYKAMALQSEMDNCIKKSQSMNARFHDFENF